MKKLKFIICVLSLFVLLTGCGKEIKQDVEVDQIEPQEELQEEPQGEPQGEIQEIIEETKIPQSSSVEITIEKIIEQEPKYKDYNVKAFTKDYINDGMEETFFVFANKNNQVNDSLYFPVDIWMSTELDTVKLYEEENILPDTYGVVEFHNKSYFRFDRSYPTESSTVLLTVDKKQNLSIAFSNLGAIKIFEGSDDFFVTHSTYDMILEDDYYVGHTWKYYYFYADDIGFHEYKAVKMTEEEFNKYENASDIKRDIMDAYEDKGTLELQYLKRSNGMIHINITLGEEDVKNFSFRNYTDINNKLEFLDEGDGFYLKSISDNEE